MTRAYWVMGAVALAAVVIAGSAPADDEKPKLGLTGEKLKLGLTGVVTDIGFGRGIGIDSFEKESVAARLGVGVKSFLWRIEVTHGKNQVDKRRTDSFKALKEALDHKDVSRITVVWRKNGVWYKNSFNVPMKLFGSPEKLDKPDE